MLYEKNLSNFLKRLQKKNEFHLPQEREMGIVRDKLKWMMSDCSRRKTKVSTMILTAGFDSII